MQLYMTHLLFVSDQTIFLLSAVKHNGCERMERTLKDQRIQQLEQVIKAIE